MTSDPKVVLRFTPLRASSPDPVAELSATRSLKCDADGGTRWHKFTVTRGGIAVSLTIKPEDRAEMERKEDQLIDLVLHHARSIKFDYSNGFVSYVDEDGKRCLRQVSELTRGNLKAEQCYKGVQQKLSEISGVRLGLTVVEGKRASDTCSAPLQRQGKKTLEGLVAQQAPSAECAIERFACTIAGLPNPNEKKLAVQNMLTAFNGLASVLKITKVDWLALHTALAFSLHVGLPSKDAKNSIDHATKLADTMRHLLQAHINRLREARWNKDQAANPYPKDPGVFARDAASLVFCFLPSLDEEILASRLFLGNEQKKESEEVHVLRYIATGKWEHLYKIPDFAKRNVDETALHEAFAKFKQARKDAKDSMQNAIPASNPGPISAPASARGVKKPVDKGTQNLVGTQPSDRPILKPAPVQHSASTLHNLGDDGRLFPEEPLDDSSGNLPYDLFRSGPPRPTSTPAPTPVVRPVTPPPRFTPPTNLLPEDADASRDEGPHGFLNVNDDPFL